MKSMKSNIDRVNLFDVPSYTKLIQIVKAVNDKPWIRPAIAVLAATGCRVSEMLYLKRGNIKFIDYHNQEIPAADLNLSDVAVIQFNLQTEKNRKNKQRIVPLIKNELFLDLVEIIVDYCKNFKYDDTLLFPYTREAVWHAVKRNIGKDFFPHYIRHINATNDARAGVSPMIQQTKFGHTDQRQLSRYSHLNYLDVINAQKNAFGGATEKEKIYEVLDKTTEARKEYNEERNFSPPPITEERAKLNEVGKHPGPDPPKTQDDIIVEKIVEAVKEMPKEDFVKEEPVPAVLPIDDPKFEPVKREYKEPKFVGPELPPARQVGQFDTVKEEGKKFFKSGMIVNDKVVIVEPNKGKIESIKKVYDPGKVIPVHMPDQKYAKQTAILMKYRDKKIKETQAKKDKEESTEFLQVV